MMKTMEKPAIVYGQRLPFKNPRNTRDLGGYPTNKGGITRYQTFIRSEDVSLFSEEELQILLNYGVKAVIDFRSVDEVIEGINPMSEMADIDYYHIPIELDGLHGDGGTYRHPLEQFYVGMLEDHRLMHTIFKVLVQVKLGTVLFHCKVGKDRTGVVAMLLLGLADVLPQDIYANYEVSNTYMAQSYDVKGCLLHHEWEALNQSHKHLIETPYRHVLEHYGGVWGYLTHIGLTPYEINRLKERLVQD